MKQRKEVLDSENYGRDAFNTYLEGRSLYKNIEWTPKPNGPNNPPDFYLSLDGNEYSIEVTETQVKQKDGIEQKGFTSSRVELVKSIEAEASKREILRGLYCICFLMPWSARLDKKLREYLKVEIFEYLDNTREQYAESPKDILSNYKMICQVFKIGNSRNAIFPSFVDGAWPESTEAQACVCKLLQDTIDTKATKLNKAMVPPPRILLMLNTYPFAYPDMYKKCLKDVHNADFFYTIFVVIGQKEANFVLYTSNAEWHD